MCQAQGGLSVVRADERHSRQGRRRQGTDHGGAHPDGVRNDLVLAAAAVAGVDRVFTIGGAQAVAALAYGSESIPQVDKIVGPGMRMWPKPNAAYSASSAST